MRLTELAHTRLAPHIREGDTVVDTTAGNGHDTLALARAVGPTGRVFAFDIQADALAATRRRVERAGFSERVTPVLASHELLREHLPAEAHGRVAVIMANLGYLPGGDTALITTPEATLRMLDTAIRMLRAGGKLSVMAYPGHPGGDTEAGQVLAFLRRQGAAQGAGLEFHGDPDDPRRSPWLAILTNAGG